MTYSLDSSGLAHMSAPCQIEPSSTHDNVSGAGRPNDAPRYPYSSPARCFTRPSRFVPVGVIGRRRSYSLRSSSLDSSAARLACSLRSSSSFRSDTALLSPLVAEPVPGTAKHRPPTSPAARPCTRGAGHQRGRAPGGQARLAMTGSGPGSWLESSHSARSFGEPIPMTQHQPTTEESQALLSSLGDQRNHV